MAVSLFLHFGLSHRRDASTNNGDCLCNLTTTDDTILDFPRNLTSLFCSVTVSHVTLFISGSVIEKWRLELKALYSGPNVCKVSSVSIMSRLADYFVVVGYDYGKECMYRAVMAHNLFQGSVSGDSTPAETWALV